LCVPTACCSASPFLPHAAPVFGEDHPAANTIILNLLLFAAYGLDGFAYAAEALTGSAAGAGRLAEFYRVVVACSVWTLASAELLSTVFALFGDGLFGLFTSHTAGIELLRRYQGWLVALPLVAAASYLLDGVFIGTALTRYRMWTMLGSLLLVYLPAWYVLQDWGNHGLWAAFLLFNGARGIGLGVCYWRISARRGWIEATG